jgi:hypothetical protein
MKDVLASLYSLHPCLIAVTQALAAKRMLIGSMITPQAAQKRLWLLFGWLQSPGNTSVYGRATKVLQDGIYQVG